MNREKLKSDHFETMEDLLEFCNRVSDENEDFYYEDYCRYFSYGTMQDLINYINNLKHQLEELEQKRHNAIELLNYVNEVKEKYTDYNPKEKDYLDKLLEILGEDK